MIFAPVVRDKHGSVGHGFTENRFFVGFNLYLVRVNANKVKRVLLVHVTVAQFF